MHQRVSQPRCRHSPRASLQYPVHGPCVAVLAAPGFHRADSFRPTASSRRSCQTLARMSRFAKEQHCAKSFFSLRLQPRLPASASLVVLSPSGTYGSFPVSARPLALPLLKGAGSAPASAAPSSSARASQAKLHKTQCQAGSFIRQGQCTRLWCALRRWCQVAFKSAPGGVPSSALTLSMNP